eukprot:s726_g28.t1
MTGQQAASEPNAAEAGALPAQTTEERGGYHYPTWLRTFHSGSHGEEFLWVHQLHRRLMPWAEWFAAEMSSFRCDQAAQEIPHQQYKELMKDEPAFAKDFPSAGNRSLRDALANGCGTVLIDCGISNEETCGRMVEASLAVV